MGRFLHILVLSQCFISLFHMDTMMLVNEQSELLAEATAEFLDSSSLNSDDNLIALKGFLRTHLESAVA